MRRWALAAALAVLVAVVPSAATADDLDDDLRDVKADIEAIKDLIGSAEGTQAGIVDEIFAIDARLDLLIEDLNEAEADLANVTAAVANTREQLELTQAELELQYRTLEGTRIELQTSKEQARQRALDIYMNGGEDFDSVVFDAEQVGELGVGVEYANQVMNSTDQLLNALEALEVQVGRQTDIVARQEERIASDVVALEEQQAQAEELTQVVEAKKADVESELAAQQELLAQVMAEIAAFQSELDGLEREHARIEQLIKEREDAKNPPPEGVFVRPVPGPITSGFGPRRHPILGYVRMHTGVDFGAGYGTPIKAATDGRVIHSSSFGGYGLTVIIDHGGGVSTLYAHQSQTAVRRGDSVSRGEVIGYVGTSGLSTGPHLHWEVRLSGRPVDPIPYL